MDPELWDHVKFDEGPLPFIVDECVCVDPKPLHHAEGARNT